MSCSLFNGERSVKKNKKEKPELLSLKNVGKATYFDLQALGIVTIKQLAKEDPDELYARLQQVTGMKHDPCVWDVFAAIIHEAKTGEKKPWWDFSLVRKAKIKPKK